MESRGRWASWEVAFNHIDEAIQQGFYIEALALEERIMADQLGLAGKGVEKKGPEFAQVDAWRKERNNHETGIMFVQSFNLKTGR